MEIDELLERACEIAHLPSMAKDQVPQVLSQETKHRIQESRISVDELARVLKKAVDQINHGSVESLDLLVRRAV